MRPKRGMSFRRFPAPDPLPPNEEALAELVPLDAAVASMAERLKVVPCDAVDEAWRLQRRQGYSTRLRALHALAEAGGAVEDARRLALGGRSVETMTYRIKKARGLVEEAKMAMMNAERERT